MTLAGHLFVLVKVISLLASSLTTDLQGGGGGVYVTPSEGVKERDKIKLSYIQAFMSF